MLLAWVLISQLLSKVKHFFIFSYVYCLCVCEHDGTLILFLSKNVLLWGQILVIQMSQFSSICVTR